MRKLKYSMGAAVVIKAAALASASVMAQTAGTASADQPNQTTAPSAQRTSGDSVILVSARRGDELLIDVPLVVDLFDAETIDRLNINSVKDLAAFTPGLEFTESQRPGNNKVALRGLTADVGRSSVALRIDDIDVTTEAINASGLGYFPNQRLLDLQRIEVVKGAQVALYGRSAFGGAINFVTRRPDLDVWSGSVSSQVTSEREWEVSAKVRGPIIEGKLGLGITAAYWDDGGTHRNQLSGERLGKLEGHGMAATLLFEPTENITNYTRVEYSEEDGNTSPGVFVAGNTDIVFEPEVAAVVNATGARVFAGTVPDGDPDGIFIALDPFTGGEFAAIAKRDFVLSNNLEVALGSVSVKSLTGYLRTRSINNQAGPFQAQPFINPDGTPNGAGTGAIAPGLVVQNFFINTDQDVVSQEIQLFSNDDGSERFRWLIGGLYWLEHIDQGQDQPTLIPLGEISTADVREFLRNQLLDETRRFNRRTEHWSAFAWAEFDITDQLSLSLEGRYSEEDILYTTLNTVNVSLGFPGANPGDAPTFTQVSVIPNPQTPGITKDSFFTPKATITFQPNPDLNFYASAAKSVKPAGHSTGSADTFGVTTQFEAEELWSYEVGVKSALADGIVNFNAAFFYQDYTNQQVATTIFDTDSNVPRGATENAGESRIYGIDADFSIRPTNNITLNGAYTYLNSKFVDYEFFTSAATGAANGPCVRIATLPNGGMGCIISYNGNRFGQVPKHQWRFFARYDGTINTGTDFFIEPSVRYRGSRSTNNANLAFAPDFYRVDLRAGVTTGDLQLTAFVENLLDDNTSTNVVNTLDFQAGFTPAALVFLPDPITVGLSARLSF